MWRSLFLSGLSALFIQTTAFSNVAVEPEDMFIISSLAQVTAGTNGGLVLGGGNVIFRERKGVEYNLGTPQIHVTGTIPNGGCLTLAAASAGKGRLSLRVRENEFSYKPGMVHDRIVIPATSLKACAHLVR